MSYGSETPHVWSSSSGSEVSPYGPLWDAPPAPVPYPDILAFPPADLVWSAAGCGRASSRSTPGKKPRRRVASVAQRRAANIRERRRMFNLNEAFDKLRRKYTLFFLSQALADINVIRRKRDMVSIKNFLYSLFGSKTNNGNIYRVFDDNNDYIKTIPDYGSNFRKMPMVNSHELIHYQGLPYRHLVEENSAQISSLKRKSLISGKSFAENNIKKYNNKMIYCNSNSDVIVPEKSKILVEKPLFIRNRLQDLIMGRTIFLPITTAKIERFIIPANKGEVHVSNYPVKRVPYKEPININEDLNLPRSSSLLSLNNNISTTTTLPDHARLTKESLPIKTNSALDISKIVRFTEPVHSRYSYKNIYQTQQNQDINVNNNNSYVTSSTVATDSTTKSVPLKKDISKGLPANYFFLPPIRTEKASVHVPVNRRKPVQENLSGDNYLDISLKYNPIVVFDHTNKRNDQAININLQEKQRGDIPDVSL
ncbi:unnamed protein product, partial [Brenthis ino]